jgi:hypothetical protein
MADIDKSLPNVGSPQDLPENDIQEEVVTDEVVETGGPVEITEEEDGEQLSTLIRLRKILMQVMITLQT